MPKLWKRILSPSFKKVYYSRQKKKSLFLQAKHEKKIHFPKANFMWIKSHENTLIRASSSSRLKALFSHSTFISSFFCCIRKSLQNQCWLQSGLVLLGYSYSKPDFLIAFSQRKLAEKSCATLYYPYTFGRFFCTHFQVDYSNSLHHFPPLNVGCNFGF